MAEHLNRRVTDGLSQPSNPLTRLPFVTTAVASDRRKRPSTYLRPPRRFQAHLKIGPLIYAKSGSGERILVTKKERKNGSGGMPDQLDVFGKWHDWQDTGVKAQEKNSRPLIRQDKQEEVDDLLISWMHRLGYPVSLDELADRLKPVGLPDGTVAAGMKRLRHAERIKTEGPEDLNCRDHTIVGQSRWIPSN